MSDNFPAVLDECLSRLKQGDTVDACLERYPEYAEDLQPLLETIQVLEPLRFTEPPRPGALASGRQRFLTEAARLQEQQEVEPSFLERIQSVFASTMSSSVWGRAAVAVVILLLLFGVLGRVAVQASESSLPGDPLYPVKQVRRQVQLLTTINAEAREEKAKEIQAEEREEVQQATEQGRVFEEDVAGVIVEWDGRSVVLEDGLHIQVTNETDIQQQPIIGRTATIRVRSEDGRLVAEEIRVQPTTEVAVAPPTETATATFTATLEPTETPRPTNTPEPTKPPPTAVPTKTPAPKITDTPTPKPTVPVGESTDIYEIRGPIDDISDDGTTWVVAGQEIQITPSTVIQGEPAEGRIARVRANRLADGTFVAVEIQVEKPNTPTPRKVFISGVVESQEGENVVYVNGRRIRKDDRTEIAGGSLKQGAYIEVEGLQESSTTVYAQKITVVRACENPVPLVGTIRSLDSEAGIWQLEVDPNAPPLTIVVDSDTQILNVPIIGARAQLETCKVGDTYVAQRIFVMPTPTPVPPTPTFTPTNTPTATPTSEPGTFQSTPTVGTVASPTPSIETTVTPTSSASPSPSVTTTTPTIEPTSTATSPSRNPPPTVTS